MLAPVCLRQCWESLDSQTDRQTDSRLSLVPASELQILEQKQLQAWVSWGFLRPASP